MDRRDESRSHNQRPRPDRSRSPPARDRNSNSDRRRDRSPLRPPNRQYNHRQPGPNPTVPRARDSPASAPTQRNSARRPNQPNQPKNNPAQTQAAQKQADAAAVMAPREGEDEDAQLSRILGFAGFRSTKNTKVPGNDKNWGVSKVKKAEYRQYMNRVGGFNRPLDAAS